MTDGQTPEVAKQSDGEFLRSLNPHPMSINGYVEQPHRLFMEFTENDIARLRAIADRLESSVPYEVAKKQIELLKQLRAWDMFTGIGAVADAGYWCGLINDSIDEFTRHRPSA